MNRSMPGLPNHHQLPEFTQTHIHTWPLAEEAEVERFYEDLQDLLELTPKTDVLFIIGDWNAKVEVKKHLEQQANLALEYGMKQSKG